MEDYMVWEEEEEEEEEEEMGLGPFFCHMRTTASRSRWGTGPTRSSAETGMNVLCGVGILSTPNAVNQGGWLGLSILFAYAVLAFYTGILLRRCLDSEPGLETYPDIGQAAFGTAGRFAVSIILYLELYACCVEYIILERYQFVISVPECPTKCRWPSSQLHLNSHVLFSVMTTLLVLPTTWLQDLSVLSYISVVTD